MRSVLLGSIVAIKGGGTPDKENTAYWGGNIPWASVKDFKTTEINKTVDYITPDGVANSASNIIPKGTVIVPTRMAVGKAAINTIDLAINQDLKALIPSAKVDPRYLLHCLLANAPRLERYATGATVKGITLDVLRNLEIPLPSLDEQRRIAAMLDAADALRTKRRAAIAKLDTLAQSIFIEMFGADRSDGNTTHNDRLGNHLSFITSGGRGWAKFYAATGSRFIRSLDVQMNNIGCEDIVFVTPPNSAEAQRTEVKAGDVLLTITGSRIGRVAALPDDLAGSYVSQHVAILRPKSSLLSRFLSFYLSSKDGQRQIAKKQYGQTKPGSNFEQINAFLIPIPPLYIQQRFVARLDDIDKVDACQRSHSAKLESLFASLQHRAFRGEL